MNFYSFISVCVWWGDSHLLCDYLRNKISNDYVHFDHNKNNSYQVNFQMIFLGF